MSPLPLGKIPIDILNATVLKYVGARSKGVLTGAKAGVDFAAIDLQDGFLIVSADPVTGVSDEAGYYAVKVSANDVATSGNRPEFAEVVMLLPEGSGEEDVAALAKQTHVAALEAGVAIVGGHTEVSPGITHPIVVVTAFARAKSFVTSAGARSGDVILMTKTAGIEGTSELANESRALAKSLPPGTVREARRMRRFLDVTPEATRAFETGAVHAMHDCTEGGVLGAVFEMSLASKLGFQLYEESVPVAKETSEVCGALGVDPLRLIGSGSLLVAVAKKDERRVERAVGKVCLVTRIGEFTEGPRVMLKKGGRKERFREAPSDELWRILGRHI